MHFVARTSIAKKLRADNEKEVIHYLGWAAWTEEGPPSGGDQIIENTDSRYKVAVHRYCSDCVPVPTTYTWRLTFKGRADP